MSYPWDPPEGDVGALQAAARALGAIATDLSQQIGKAKTAAAEAKAEWHAPRADDFEHAGQALVDELGMVTTGIGQTANLIGQWATAVQTATTNIATWKQKYDAVANPAKGAAPVDATSAAQEEIYYHQQACNEHTNLQTYAGRIAAAIDHETGLAVPKAAGLSPAEIVRRVDASLGMDDFTRNEYYTGQIDDNAIWDMLHTADGPVFDDGVPAPGDGNFQAWYASLTPSQQLLETQKLATSFTGQDFDPYKTIQGGTMPAWAQAFNAQHQNTCTVDGKMGDGYGYFGGGTILGPGGKQWPIVMPYYNDGKNTYMDDGGQERADGGINQLDGKDPGWHTVTTWTGAGQFGSISTTTKLATAFLIGTGQELETTETDPDAVQVGADGHAYAGDDVHSMPSGPQDKAWWDVTSDTMFPKPLEGVTPQQRVLDPNSNAEWVEPALGANALLVQAGQAAVAVHNEDSHATRQYYVDYQVNDDGRTRAVVHTYSAAPTDGGKTYVGSFANTFPTGQSGSTTEIPYKTRFNDYDHAVMTAAPDPNVEYSNQSDEEVNNNQPIQEKLNK